MHNIKETVWKEKRPPNYLQYPPHKSCTHTFDMFSQVLLLLLSITPFSSPAPVAKRAFSNGPVITSNFPDPAFINVGGTYYAFATSNGAQNVQIATSPDFDTWTVTGSDALPAIPSWSTGDVWAPDVAQLVRTSTNTMINGRLTMTG